MINHEELEDELKQQSLCSNDDKEYAANKHKSMQKSREDRQAKSLRDNLRRRKTAVHKVDVQTHENILPSRASRL